MGIKVIIEKDEYGYRSYPLGFNSNCLAVHGDSYEETLNCIQNEIKAYILKHGLDEFFGKLEQNRDTVIFIDDAEITL